MSKATLTHRSAWMDRFRTPSAEDLLNALSAERGALVGQARQQLAALETVRESLSWVGLPWRWTFVYRRRGDQRRPIAYLVPNPEGPELAIPLADRMIADLGFRKLPRFVREGIIAAVYVNGVHWASWELASQTVLDELLSLVRRCLSMSETPADPGRGGGSGST